MSKPPPQRALGGRRGGAAAGGAQAARRRPSPPRPRPSFTIPTPPSPVPSQRPRHPRGCFTVGASCFRRLSGCGNQGPPPVGGGGGPAAMLRPPSPPLRCGGTDALPTSTTGRTASARTNRPNHEGRWATVAAVGGAGSRPRGAGRAAGDRRRRGRRVAPNRGDARGPPRAYGHGTGGGGRGDGGVLQPLS